ncbi:MAG TPA: hypothetical protein PLF01_01875 [Alphaproteobacteria bacterium]|nr:hypothetical protein [Alphaproteobacteria bacterium]
MSNPAQRLFAAALLSGLVVTNTADAETPAPTQAQDSMVKLSQVHTYVCSKGGFIPQVHVNFFVSETDAEKISPDPRIAAEIVRPLYFRLQAVVHNAWVDAAAKHKIGFGDFNKVDTPAVRDAKAIIDREIADIEKISKVTFGVESFVDGGAFSVGTDKSCDIPKVEVPAGPRL